MFKKIMIFIIFVLGIFLFNVESVLGAEGVYHDRQSGVIYRYDTGKCIDDFGTITFLGPGNNNNLGGKPIFSGKNNNLDWNTDPVSYEVEVQATAGHNMETVYYSIGSKYGYSCKGTITGDIYNGNKGSVKFKVEITKGYVNDMAFWGKSVDRDDPTKKDITESNTINVNKLMTDSELEALGHSTQLEPGETLTCHTIDDLLGKYWSWVLILAPVGTMVLITIDFLSCMLSSDREALAKTGKKTLNRTITLVILLMLPIITSIIFGLFGIETCF